VDFLTDLEFHIKNHLSKGRGEWFQAFKYAPETVLRAEIISLDESQNVNRSLSSYLPEDGLWEVPGTVSRLITASAQLMNKPTESAAQEVRDASEKWEDATLVMRFNGLLLPVAVVLRSHAPTTFHQSIIIQLGSGLGLGLGLSFGFGFGLGPPSPIEVPSSPCLTGPSSCGLARLSI